MLSTTSTSTGQRIGSSFSPSCSCIAVTNAGRASSGSVLVSGRHDIETSNVPGRPSRRALGPWLQAGSELFVRARERHDVDRLLARLEVGCEAKALDEQGAHSLAATITTSCAPELAAALIVVAIIGSF